MIVLRDEYGDLPRVLDAQTVEAESAGEKSEVSRSVVEHG
jgi:hypothetical protein